MKGQETPEAEASQGPPPPRGAGRPTYQSPVRISNSSAGTVWSAGLRQAQRPERAAEARTAKHPDHAVRWKRQLRRIAGTAWNVGLRPAQRVSDRVAEGPNT